MYAVTSILKILCQKNKKSEQNQQQEKTILVYVLVCAVFSEHSILQQAIIIQLGLSWDPPLNALYLVLLNNGACDNVQSRHLTNVVWNPRPRTGTAIQACTIEWREIHRGMLPTPAKVVEQIMIIAPPNIIQDPI